MASLWGRVLRSTQEVVKNVINGAPEVVTKGSGSATNAKDRLAWMITAQQKANKQPTQQSIQIPLHEQKNPAHQRKAPKIETETERTQNATKSADELVHRPNHTTEPSDLRKLYGVGPKVEQRLHESKIFTIQQLSSADDATCNALKRKTKSIISLRKRAQTYLKNNKE